MLAAIDARGRTETSGDDPDRHQRRERSGDAASLGSDAAELHLGAFEHAA
jgi:hypothetical protein